MNKIKRIALRITEKERKSLDKIANKKKISLSQVIREAVNYYLERK